MSSTAPELDFAASYKRAGLSRQQVISRERLLYRYRDINEL